MRLIDAVAYRKELEEEKKCDRNEDVLMGLEIAIVDLGDMPTIEAESIKYGVWIWDEANQGYYCPHCPTIFWKSSDVPDAFKRCPNCGARMDLEDNNADD